MRRDETESLAANARPTATQRQVLRPGMRLGRYELLDLIGRGGMGEVWRARQLGEFRFSRTVALKTMRPDLGMRSDLRAMFLDEARLASRVRHENVVEVLDLGTEGGWIFQALEYVPGMSVSQLRDACTETETELPLGIANRMIVDVCLGLHAAHSMVDDMGRPLGLVHRDVSPHNMLISTSGVTKLTDFGIAKAVDRESPETDTGLFKGKLGYASPEQVAGEELDRRADICAAGIVLWELIAGRRLFGGTNAFDRLARIRAWEIPSIALERPEVSEALTRACMRALARDQAERFATARELAEAIEAAGPIATRREVEALLRRFSPEASEPPPPSAPAESDARSAKPAVTGRVDAVTETVVDLEARGEAPSKWKTRVAVGTIALATFGVAAVVRHRASPEESSPAPSTSTALAAPESLAAPSVSAASSALPAPEVAAQAPAASASASASARGPLAAPARAGTEGKGVSTKRSGPRRASPTIEPKFRSPYE